MGDPEQANSPSLDFVAPTDQVVKPAFQADIRVLLVEDQPIVVAGLIAALERAEGIEVAGHAPHASAARMMLNAHQIDVVLLDLHLPSGTAAQLLVEQRERVHGPAMLVLSSFVSRECLRAAIELGASGFLVTTSPVQKIVEAIRAVHAGARSFTPQQLRDAEHFQWIPLSPRDHEIVAGLVRGRSNDELSAHIGVSRKTIELHLTRLFARFGVLSRTELAVQVERDHILELPVESMPPTSRATSRRKGRPSRKITAKLIRLGSAS